MNKEIFDRAYAKAQERIIENDIVYAHIGEGNSCKIGYVQKIYDAALAHPYTTVRTLLDNLNISMTQYKNMKLTHMSIPEYRRQNLGKTRILSQYEKDVLASNLKKKQVSKKSSKTRNKVMKKVGEGDIDSEYLMNKLNRKEEFNLDNA